jgi:GTP-binding protein HflX
LEVCGRIFQNLSAPDNRTYVGTGKLEELLEQARSLEVDTLIFDDELRPSQARNVERVANAAGGSVRIVDRVELILDIFRQRAATREGFLQVQLARIEYQLPRLTKLWQHLERQTGGGGLAVKGMGESQLDIDKRLLKVQRARIQEKLERCAVAPCALRSCALTRRCRSVRTHRALHRMRRAAAPLPVVALCGYTSAGKSTLLNLLTNADAYTDPMLFATLDPTTRRANVPGSGQAVLITDTVGFVQVRFAWLHAFCADLTKLPWHAQKLPTQLVAAFRCVTYAPLAMHSRP